MGPPGSGKTSLGKRLAQRLNYFWIDVDDHVLEPEWKCSVADKLVELGDKSFLEVKILVLKSNTFFSKENSYKKQIKSSEKLLGQGI